MISLFSHLFSARNPLSRAKQQLLETEMERLEAAKLAEYYTAMCDMLAERKDRLELYVDTYGKTVAEIDAFYFSSSRPISKSSEEIVS